MVVKVNEDSFQKEVLAADQLVLVDLYADWCGPCKMMAPVIEALSEANQDVKFCKVNVDEAMGIAQQYRVAAVPTFLFLKKGELVEKMVGGNSPEEFQKVISRLK